MNEQLNYVQQLEIQINDAKKHLGRLKAEQQTALVKAQHEEIENLEKYLAEADVNLSGLKTASEDAWQTLKADIDRLLENIRDAIQASIKK